jgi:hypothetical protein
MKAFPTYIESHVSNFNETNNSLKFMLMKALTTYTLQRPLKSTMFQESNYLNHKEHIQ